MKVSTYFTWTVTLDKDEQFKYTNANGNEFMVNTIASISYKEGFVFLRGFAINKDGNEGIIHRTTSAPIGNLPDNLRGTVESLVHTAANV